MSEPIHVFGDGVAGLCSAEALHRAGHRVVVHGDGGAHRGAMTAMVHLHAGRSFRTTDIEEAAFGRLRSWATRWVRRGTAVSTSIVRPVVGQTGERLQSSLDSATDTVERIDDPVFGDCFRYAPAFGFAAGATLQALAASLLDAGVEFRSGRADPTDLAGSTRVLAVGTDLPRWLPDVDLRLYGGDLVTLEMQLDRAFSAGGIHGVPTTDGAACVGSTWWSTEDEAPAAASSIAELGDKLRRLGMAPGDVRSAWRGVRCVHHSDRRPLVGRISETRHVVGALGTRGWFWAPYLAELVVASVAGEELPRELDVQRA